MLLAHFIGRRGDDGRRRAVKRDSARPTTHSPPSRAMPMSLSSPAWKPPISPPSCFSTLGHATLIGPILMGMAKPVHVLSPGADEAAIVNMAAIAVVDAQERMGQTSGASAPGPTASPVSAWRSARSRRERLGPRSLMERSSHDHRRCRAWSPEGSFLTGSWADGRRRTPL